MLMGFGALATIAIRKPANLTLAVLDNGHFGETGMQESHAGRGPELDQDARTCGFSWSNKITDLAGVDDLRETSLRHQGTRMSFRPLYARRPPL